MNKYKVRDVLRIRQTQRKKMPASRTWEAEI